MWVEHDITGLELDGLSSITVGAFDGVHLGHRALIQQMVTTARQHQMRSVVVTFDPLPGAVLNRQGYGQLCDLDDRIALIEAIGVTGTVVLPFDAEMMATSAADFVSLLTRHLALTELWIGPDFHLGRSREGDAQYLKQLGVARGFEVRVFTRTVHWAGEPVRSSRIRRALESGDVEQANGCLGYPYRLTGVVEHGDKRGRALGFPTANLRIPEGRLLPTNGVYVCRAQVETVVYNAIANVGTRPTFNGHRPKVEAYLLDFSGELYGTPMRLDFLTRLRPEYRYATVDALIDQMQRDEAQARQWLASHAGRRDAAA